MAKMATSFQKFPDLTSELRLMIWNEALLGERNSRTVILQDDRVMPLKHLISPLLSVNYESRTCAQAFYNVKLDVYAVPKAQDEPIGGLIANADYWTSRLGKGGIAPYRAAIRRIIHDVVAPMAIERAAHRMGTVYVNLEQDTLILGYECGLHLLPDMKMKLLGETHPDPEDFPWAYITSKLPAAACEKASSLIRITVTIPRLSPSDPNLRDNLYRFAGEFPNHLALVSIRYSKRDAGRLWKENLFPRPRYLYNLPLDMLEHDRFLHRIITSGGCLPYNLERWVYYTGEFSQGETIVVDKQRWEQKLDLEKEKEKEKVASSHVQG
ncbi:hypothetical protein VSDG_09021 [Cytospora chrysosperma]|uniref:2EXR domain-containing protein n=1 Tax=Cytospora chrysosperma TaxID=252740 RepID=A0A423VBT1_CYTCH|nr:hypothetical protein VSDG_09021 [Valsa sordida]